MTQLSPTPCNRVLLIDDDEANYLTTKKLLNELPEQPFSIAWESSYQGGLAALESRGFDVCLLADRLGNRTGLEMLEQVARTPCATPIVFVTGTDSGRMATDVVAAGAQDYLAKGEFGSVSLARVIRHAMERHRVTAALKESERQFRAIFEMTTEAILLVNDEGSYVDCNAAACELQGLSKQDLLRRSVFDALLGDSIGGSAQEWREFLAGSERRAEVQLRRTDGQERTVEYSARPNIRPHLHLWVLRDITERKRADEPRARMADIVEATSDAILGLSLDGTIITWNRGAEQTYGYSASEIVGQNVAVLVPLSRQQELMDILDKMQRGEEIRNLDTVRVTKDGREIFVALTMSPHTDRNGAPIGASTIARDVTESRMLLARLNAADRMASLGILAAGVGHEINNPLACIIANLELCTEDLSAAKLKASGELHRLLDDATDALSDASSAADRLRRIVRDLRIFSRAEDEDKIYSLDLHDVLESTLRLAWNEIRHRARLVKDFGRIPPIMSNDARLGQVFLNLVVNAAQAISEGDTEHNEIRIVTRLEGTEHVVVEVRDSGRGIEACDLPRVFEPFFTTKPAGLGTGLGLSICKRLVQGLGGQLSVKSEPGQGSVFFLQLPVAQALAPHSVLTSMPPAQPVRRARLLVIDDDPHVASSLQRLLGAQHDVVTATSAESAMAWLTNGELYDVVFCDVMMPEMSGRELYQKLLRSAPQLASRMAFVSGGVFTPEARAFFDEVPNPRFEKPFDKKAILAFVAERVRQRAIS